MNRTAEITKLTKRLHDGQVDLQGVDYVHHLRAVAAGAGRAAGPSAWVVGMLHDAVEDGKISFKDLRHHVGEDELIAIGLLTREKGVPYPDYIERIRVAPGPAGVIVRAVKRADLDHNLGRMTDEIRKAHPNLERRYVEARQSLGEEAAEMVTS